MENLNQETNHYSNDLWQAEVLGQIYDTNFAEMTEWIGEGALQPSDKVRRGNLRWIEAGKVPAFIPFFNANGNGVNVNDVKINPVQFSDADRKINSADSKNCFIHDRQKAAFECEICLNSYCQNCIPVEQDNACPICGANCRSLNLVDTVLRISNPSAKTVNFGSANLNTKSTYSETKSAQILDSPVRFPSDVVKTRTKGISIFFVIFFALGISGICSYLWAYKYNLESESALESLPEVTALDAKFKTDLEQAIKNRELREAEKIRKEERKKINENQYPVAGQMIDARKELNEIDNQMLINKYADEETIKKETHSRERAGIIGNYQESRSKNNFITAFIGSFIFSFAGLFTVRYFTKK